MLIAVESLLESLPLSAKDVRVLSLTQGPLAVACSMVQLRNSEREQDGPESMFFFLRENIFA